MGFAETWPAPEHAALVRSEREASAEQQARLCYLLLELAEIDSLEREKFVCVRLADHRAATPGVTPPTLCVRAPLRHRRSTSATFLSVPNTTPSEIVMSAPEAAPDEGGDLALIQIDALTWIGSAPRGEHGALRHPASRLVPSLLIRTPYLCSAAAARRQQRGHPLRPVD
jgi:hypothetical protein